MDTATLPGFDSHLHSSIRLEATSDAPFNKSGRTPREISLGRIVRKVEPSVPCQSSTRRCQPRRIPFGRRNTPRGLIAFLVGSNIGKNRVLAVIFTDYTVQFSVGTEEAAASKTDGTGGGAGVRRNRRPSAGRTQTTKRRYDVAIPNDGTTGANGGRPRAG